MPARRFDARIATAAGRTGGTCLGSAVAKVNYGAGGLTDTRSATHTFTGYDFPCHMSDPTIQWGIEAGSGSGTYNCSKFSGLESGIDKFSWSNGRKSVVTYTDTIVNGIGDTRGVVTSGEFKGLQAHYVGPSIPFPDVCTSPNAGTSQGLFLGTGSFGDFF